MYLGIDCGTQGTKALVVAASGRTYRRGYAPHALIERATGAREQQPAWWIDAMKAAVGQALGASPAQDVLALSVSGQQHGLVVLDEACEVIRPAKLWNEAETAPQNEELIQRFGRGGWPIHGCPIHRVFAMNGHSRHARTFLHKASATLNPP